MVLFGNRLMLLANYGSRLMMLASKASHHTCVLACPQLLKTKLRCISSAEELQTLQLQTPHETIKAEDAHACNLME